MKNLILFAFVFTLIVGLSNITFAQKSATATSDAKAYIATGIAISNTSELNFGNIVRSAAGGTVSINAAGAMTYTGVFNGQNSNPTTSAFSVTGEANYLYDITLPTSITLTRDGGAETMTVNNFVNSSAGQLSALGAQSFTVGATLNVGALQAVGSYAGTFDVTVQYQ